MEILIDTSVLKEDSIESVCHHLPCAIDHKGEASVSSFFTPYIRPKPEHGDRDILQCSFRGRPLLGSQFCLPNGYLGVVLKQVEGDVGIEEEEKSRKLTIAGKFQKFTYWNWDRLPSKEDKIVQAADWLEVAEALHAPVNTEEQNVGSGGDNDSNHC